ncbi:MAG: dodecin domain-containing protein [Candidatus Cloacimonadota bacterium]|nr:MAG: dodecin domain-containing protein [Candidatus Cloacimonadota bacterium]
MDELISQGAVKIIEVVGVSDKSFDDAVTQAVAKASKTVEGITGLEVLKYTAKVKDGSIIQYRANVKLAFPVK